MDSGLTAHPGISRLESRNRDIILFAGTIRHHRNGIPIAVMLQYGHGTRNGGYVEGRDYIMPAIRPIFDQIAAEAWREVTKV